MMKVLKGLLSALAAGLASVALVACGGGGTESSSGPSDSAGPSVSESQMSLPQNSESGSVSESVNAEPDLDVSAETVEGKVRAAVTLPTATATDEDGDLTAAIRIKILFEDDARYVLPTVKVSEGVLLSENLTYVPEKVGSYKITYFVKDSAGKESSAVVSMTAVANEDDEIGYNLAAIDKTGDWIVGESDQNSALNDYGEMVIAGKTGTNYTGAVYKGSKIRNGDTVAFSFIAQPCNEVMFYNVSFLLTPSAAAEEPTSAEGTWPKFFNMRIGASVTTYVSTLSNNNLDLFPQMNVNLCDGTLHTIAIRITADAEKVEGQLWIDAETTASPSASATVRKTVAESKYGEGSEALNAFDGNISGWLSFGANVTGADTRYDGMTIKSVSVNGNNPILPPELKIGDFGRMTPGTAYSLPEATAKDKNDYSDLTAKIRLYVKAPDGEFVLWGEETYTPAEAGKYVFRYVVTDRSGNTEYEEITVNCSKGESSTLPSIVFDDGVTETYDVLLGETFVVPAPESVTDSFGDDISALLKISLTGREQTVVGGGESFVFRATGDHILRYEAEDYNGNVAFKEIVVTVTGGATGNILENADDWYIGNGASLANDEITVSAGGASFAYGGQKIYDEKVSMLVNLDIANGSNGNGSGIVLINVRGGKNLTKVPKTVNQPDGTTDFGWPDGVSILFSSLYGLIVKSAGYNGSDYAVASLPAGIYETFRGREVELSFQMTDVYDEENELLGVRLRMWLDGVKVNFGGSFVDSDGDVWLTPRVVRLNENIMQAGWLSFYFNDVDTVDGEKTVIRALTIDSSKPVKTVISVDKESNQSFVLGEEYVLPVVTVTAGEEDRSSQVKKFIWITGEEKPDLTGEGYAAASIVPDMAYMKGFTVIYVYGGKEIKSVLVQNSSVSATFAFGEESYTAVLGQDFAMPRYTAFFGSIDATDDVSVTMKLGLIEEEFTADVYRPTTAESFTLEYYLYGVLVGRTTVNVTGGASKKDDLSASGQTTGGKAWLYAGERIYNNKVQIGFSLSSALAANEFVDFGMRGSEQTTSAWFSWSKGLRVFLKYDPTWGVYFKIGTGANGAWLGTSYGESKLKYTDVDWTQNHTITYSVCDVYGDGAFTGIRAELWLDGVRVNFNAEGGAQTETDGSSLFIPASVIGTADAADFIPGYVFVWSNNKDISVSRAYIMETDEDAYPVRKFVFDKKDEQQFTPGTEYVLPVLTVTEDGTDKSADVKVFIFKEGETKDLTGAPYAGTSVTPDDGYGSSFIVTYVYGGEEIASITVVNAAGESKAEIVFGENAYTVALGESYTLPTFTATLGSTDVTADVTVGIRLGYHETVLTGSVYKPTAAQAFTLVYTFGGEIIAEKEVTVTGGAADGVNVASAGKTTNAGAWAYVNEQIYDRKVKLTFSLSSALTAGEFVDFGVRGNEQTTDAWFSNSKGLRIFLKYDPSWGVYFNVGTGNNNGWIGVNFGESKLKYTAVDWTQKHTVEYAVCDVYENGAFKGIRVELWLDGTRVCFNANGSAQTDADGSYLLIPQSYLATADETDYIASYVFIWCNGKTIDVSEAYISALTTDGE